MFHLNLKLKKISFQEFFFNLEWSMNMVLANRNTIVLVSLQFCDSQVNPRFPQPASEKENISVDITSI